MSFTPEQRSLQLKLAVWHVIFAGIFGSTLGYTYAEESIPGVGLSALGLLGTVYSAYCLVSATPEILQQTLENSRKLTQTNT